MMFCGKERSKRRMHLYEMTDQMSRLLEFDDDSLGIDSMLLDLEGDINAKTEGTCMVIRTLEAEAKAFAEEAKRMQGKATARVNRIKGLKEYLMVNLQAAGLTSAGGSILKANIQRGNPRCVVVDEWAVPEAFIRIIPEKREVDKRGIMTNVRETGEVPDGVEIEQTYSLRVR